MATQKLVAKKRNVAFSNIRSLWYESTLNLIYKKSKEEDWSYPNTLSFTVRTPPGKLTGVFKYAFNVRTYFKSHKNLPR